MWHIFRGVFNAIFWPSFTSIPPRFHHQKTTSLQQVFAKTPLKSPSAAFLKNRRVNANPHPTKHGIAYPTTGKANKLPQPDPGLHYRWRYRCRLRYVSGPYPPLEQRRL
jgi:hypothetical protein